MSLIPSESYSFPDQFVRTIRPSKVNTARSTARAPIKVTENPPIEPEPMIQEQAMPEPIVSQPVVHEQVMPEPIVSQPVVHEPVMPESIVSQPVVHQQVMPEPIMSQPVVHEQVMPEPIVSQPVVHEPVMPEPIMSQPMIAFPSDPVLEMPVAPEPIFRDLEGLAPGPMEPIFFEPVAPVAPVIARAIVDESAKRAPIAIKPIRRETVLPAPTTSQNPVLPKPARERSGPEVMVRIEPRRNPRPVAAASPSASITPIKKIPSPIIARSAPPLNVQAKTNGRMQTSRPYGPVRTSSSVIRAPRVEPRVEAPRPVAKTKVEAPQPMAETMELFADEEKIEMTANETANDSSFDELLLAEVPARQARRHRRLTGFIISEVLSLGVLGASLVLTFSHRFPNPNVVLSLNIATIAAAVVAAMVPIIFFAVGPTLPHGDN